MQIPIMSLVLLSAGLFDTVLGGGSNVIPTREEQANLLTDVEEVFEQIKVLVNVEANATDVSVVGDIDKMVTRAEDKLSLVKELSLMKMSWNSNSVCTLEYHDALKRLVKSGMEELKACSNRGAEEVTYNSCQLTNATQYATRCGQDLLDTLYNCSRKPGLQVIGCYKNVIAQDVGPVKRTLLEAIGTHREGHLRTIEIRNMANDCVDDILDKYRVKMDRVLYEALHCST